MLSQYQVNEVCQMLKRDAQEITIAKVRKLLGKHYSFFDVADKVLLYKENSKKAQEIAKKETIKIEEKPVQGLGLMVEQALVACAVSEHRVLALSLKEKLQNYIDQEIKKRVDQYALQSKKILQKNDHLEVNFYGARARLQKLSEDQKLLKEQNYLLQQQLQKVQTQKNYRIAEESHMQRPVQVRDYQTQIVLLNTDCCAVYDVQKQNIVVKMPPKHKLEREFQKGIHSIYLRAHAIYDFVTKYWFLYQYEAKTINLLVRNNFIISKELSYILQKLQE